MASYNIIVKTISKTSSGFSGTFSLTDNEFVVSQDGGRTMNRCQATVSSGVETIVYEGTLRPKINNTQGQGKDKLAVAQIGEDQVHVLWTQGHRGAVAAAFMAVWNEVSSQIGVGETMVVDKTNPKGGRTGGVQVTAPVVNNEKVTELEAKLAAQTAMLEQLMAMLANKG